MDAQGHKRDPEDKGAPKYNCRTFSLAKGTGCSVGGFTPDTAGETKGKSEGVGYYKEDVVYKPPKRTASEAGLNAKQWGALPGVARQWFAEQRPSLVENGGTRLPPHSPIKNTRVALASQKR